MKAFPYTLILACGGSSRRYGGDKLLEKVNGKYIFEYAYQSFLEDIDCKKIILVIPLKWKKIKTKILKHKKLVSIYGGDTRFNSIKKGLSFSFTDFTIVHDGPRPFFRKEILDELKKFFVKERKKDITIVGSILYKKVSSLLVDGNNKPLKDVKLIETPQLYCTNELKTAYQNASHGDYRDSSTVLIDQGYRLVYMLNESPNYKITYKIDLEIHKHLLINN